MRFKCDTRLFFLIKKHSKRIVLRGCIDDDDDDIHIM